MTQRIWICSSASAERQLWWRMEEELWVQPCRGCLLLRVSFKVSAAAYRESVSRQEKWLLMHGWANLANQWGIHQKRRDKDGFTLRIQARFWVQLDPEVCLISAVFACKGGPEHDSCRSYEHNWGNGPLRKSLSPMSAFSSNCIWTTQGRPFHSVTPCIARHIKVIHKLSRKLKTTTLKRKTFKGPNLITHSHLPPVHIAPKYANPKLASTAISRPTSSPLWEQSHSFFKWQLIINTSKS